jgi:putative transposase
MAHRRRGEHDRRLPVHLTMRGCTGLPSFRAPRVFAAIREALAAASGDGFRVIQFSVQSDHLHLIAEADDRNALSSGTRGLAIRAARAINRVAHRQGRVWADRYHVRELTTPRETRHALVYVLFNFKKHHPADPTRIDPCSSAPWFNDFREPIPRLIEPAPVHRPKTWLARVGWQKAGGRIGLSERPRPP